MVLYLLIYFDFGEDGYSDAEEMRVWKNPLIGLASLLAVPKNAFGHLLLLTSFIFSSLILYNNNNYYYYCYYYYYYLFAFFKNKCNIILLCKRCSNAG